MADAILDELRKVVAANGSQKETARVFCISPQYLCDILHGRREISAEVAEILGFERVVTYRPRSGAGDGNQPQRSDAVDPVAPRGQEGPTREANALSHSPSPDVLRAWEPIETCPKDAISVLAAWPEVNADGGVEVGEAWREDEGEDIWWYLGSRIYPTHWMPLPAAPPRP